MKNFLKVDVQVRRMLLLVPRADIMENWRRDYENMCNAMIYGEKPTWAELIDAMEQLQIRVRKIGVGR